MALSDDLAAYEAGTLDWWEELDLFQRLIDTGLPWQLQGRYGRIARDLLDAGLITDQPSSWHQGAGMTAADLDDAIPFRGPDDASPRRR